MNITETMNGGFVHERRPSKVKFLTKLEFNWSKTQAHSKNKLYFNKIVLHFFFKCRY